MSGGADDDDTVLAEREKQLGTARTGALRPSATITPRTLAQSDQADPEAIGPAGAAFHQSHAATIQAPTLDGLPHFSVDERDAPLGAGRSGSATRADYALVSTLGEGGMGRVHLARQRSLERDVAVKTLKPSSPREAGVSLVREARITGALEHPGVIPVHLLGLDGDGRPMLVMKRVDGVDFAALLADPAHPAWRARGRPADRLLAGIEILEQVCLTVEFAHSRGVLHRDIKPENVMVGAFGEVYLVDWGIAKPKDEPPDAKAIVGTPAYMAPEMVRCAAIDERTDVYLLGAMLHELLTGRPRHDGKTVMDVLRHALLSAPHVFGDDVPEPLAALANRATSRDPSQRPESAAAFREALEDYVRHRGAHALSDAAEERLDALERALAEAKDGVPADLPGAYRLATEARFGLTQSLREHARHVPALAAMRRALAASIELELRQGHADTANALYRELDPPDEALAARIAAARELAAERAREHARLETMDKELDPSQEGRRRVLPIVAVSVTSTVIGSTAVLLSSGRVPSNLALVGIAVVSFVAIGAGVLAFRKRVLGNAFNRRMSALMLLAVAAMVVDRILGLAESTPPLHVLHQDMGVMASVTAAGAISLWRGFAWGSVLMLVALGAALIWPAATPPIFIAAIVGVLMIVAVTLPTKRGE